MTRIAARLQRRSTQRGQVLLGIVVILGIVFGALFYTFVSPANSAAEREKITNAALAQARDALIGYASAQKFTGSGERPGDLPCPDRNDNGSADDGNCNTIDKRIGRLPWKTLGIPDLRDGWGERLWYAISVNFKDNQRIGVLNSDTPGEYKVTGVTSADNVLAIVFAAGPPLGLQIRSSATAACVTTGTTIARNLCADNYLDGDNANGDTSFTTALPTDTFNDKLMLITSDVLFPAVTMRVARETRTFLQAYFDNPLAGYYPFASDYSDSTFNCTPGLLKGRIPNLIGGDLATSPCALLNWSGTVSIPPWYTANNWHQLVFYAVAPACTAPGSNCLNAGGFLTVNGTPAPNNDKRAIVIVTGRRLSGQSPRPCASVADCVEDPENINGNNVFVKPDLSPADNDRLVIVSP